MDVQNCTYVMHGNDLWVVCRHLSPTHSMHGSQTNASSSFQSCTSKPCTYIRIWTIPPWALFAHETVTHINIRVCNFLLSCAPRSVSALNGRTVTKLQFLLAPTVQGRNMESRSWLCYVHITGSGPDITCDHGNCSKVHWQSLLPTMLIEARCDGGTPWMRGVLTHISYTPFNGVHTPKTIIKLTPQVAKIHSFIAPTTVPCKGTITWEPSQLSFKLHMETRTLQPRTYVSRL